MKNLKEFHEKFIKNSPMGIVSDWDLNLGRQGVAVTFLFKRYFEGLKNNTICVVTLSIRVISKYSELWNSKSSPSIKRFTNYTISWPMKNVFQKLKFQTNTLPDTLEIPVKFSPLV